MNLDIGGFDPTILLLIVPIVLVQLGLTIAAVVDLLRDERKVRGGSKGVWAVIIVFVNLLGPILYFLVGRVEGVADTPGSGPGAMPGWGSPHDPPIAAGPATGTPVPGGTPDPTALSSGTVPTPGPVLGATVVPDPQIAGGTARGVDPLPDGPPAIVVEGLTKRYPGGVLALDGLSMVVPAGSVFGLLGPKGAGKTTCLRLLAGLTRPTGGRAVVNGTVVAANALAVRRGLGYLEQDPRVYGWMTGREQLSMLGRLHGLDGVGLAAAVHEALARVDLADAADRRTGTY